MQQAAVVEGLALRVAALYVYPVKACAGVAVQRLQFDAAGGVAGDRQWAVTDDQGVVTWQGSVPRLACVRPRPCADGLVLEAPGMAPLQVQAGEGQDCEVRLWNEATQAHDVFAARRAREEVQAWLAQAAGAPVRLVQLGLPARVRDTLNPVHIVSRRSVAALNERLRAAGAPPAAVERFRPNIVLDGDDLQPFDEDHVARIHWDHGAALHVTEACVRCVVVNVDPCSGAVGGEPLASVGALSAQRRPGAPVSFGVYARAAAHTGLAVGEQGIAELAF